MGSEYIFKPQQIQTLMENEKELKEGVAMVYTLYDIGLHMILGIWLILGHVGTFEITHVCENQYVPYES